MIHFNELYVTEDGKHLVIDAEIDDLDVYKNCYIDQILVDIGENCEGGGKSNNAVTLFTNELHVVGDLNNDAVVTTRDVEDWYILWDLCSGKKLEEDEQGLYYENYEEEKVYVRQELLNIFNLIITEYSTGKNISPKVPLVENLAPFLAYIVDIIGDNILMGRTPLMPGDLNGDGEVSIGDINHFFDYLLRVAQGTEQPLFVGEKTKHFRKCYDVNDLVPLVDIKANLSSYLFIVTVHASCFGDISKLTASDCGYDIDEITGVAYNGKPLYNTAVSNASSYGDTCDTNDASAFEDFVLRYYAFLFALRCGDLCKAQYYWENYLKTGNKSNRKSISFKPCGCHGTYL